MKKLLLLLPILLTGCATYVGVEQPTSPNPIYPPVYDVEPLKQLLYQTQTEAIKLEKFVKSMQSQNLINLERSLHSYKYSAKDLYDSIVNSPTASVNYTPWQTY
jgi:hypothetical protein